MNYLAYNYGVGYGMRFPAWALSMFLLLLAWSFFWKGLSLWHAAQRKQGWWFTALLLVNTLGLLEIIYLFAIAKVPTAELLSSKKKSS